MNHLKKENYSTKIKFDTKRRTYDYFKIAGMETSTLHDGFGFDLYQSDFASPITLLTSHCSFSDFRANCQGLSCLVHTRPDIACALSLACQVTETLFSLKDAAQLDKVIMTSKKRKVRRLFHQKLDINSLRIKMYSDAAFASRQTYRPQLGYMVFICDANNRCYLSHFGSHKSK